MIQGAPKLANFIRSRASSTIMLVLALLAIGVYSDEACAQNEQDLPRSRADETLGEVVVSGTRISGFTAPTPVTSLTAMEIELIGAMNVGELSDEIPALQQTQNPTVSTSSGINAGGSSFDLRGLGRQRTLTLIDGRRHVPNTIRATLDSNVIPSSIVERLDVVTGGASAVYGSDALAGVVNIILRDDIDGFEGSIQSGASTHGDYEQFGATLHYGGGFREGKGHLLVAGEYRNSDGVGRQSSRDWAQGDWGVVNNASFVPGTGQFRRLVTQDARAGNATFGGLITNGVLAGTQFLSDSSPATFDPGSNALGSANTIGGDGPNLNGMRALAVALERKTFYAQLDYELNENISAFIEGSYANSEGHNDGYINTFHAGGGALTIRQDNAFLDDSLRAMMVAAGQQSFRLGRINSDFPAFGTLGRNKSLQINVGLEGSLGETWTWEAYYGYGDNEEINTSFNDVRTDRLALAVDAVVDPATGQIVCRSTLTSPSNGCVPINMFGSGSPSPQAVSYVTETFPNTVTYGQDVASISIEGRPFSLWAGPVSVAAGGEYRREELGQNTDPGSEARAHLLVNWVPAQGSVSYKEVFAETVVPLLKDSPLGRSLELNAAVRAADQDLTGIAHTWKAGIIYDITDDFRIRATHSRDIRSPNFSELALTPPAALTTVIDLNGVATTVFRPELPNPNLDPEEADTWTAGIIYRPSWASGLALSADYYEIDLHGLITRFAAQTVVDACRTEPAFCEFLIRDSAGNLTEVRLLNLNAGKGLANGVDLEFSYQMDAGNLIPSASGSLTFRALGSYTKHNNSEIRGVFIEEIGDTFPHWQANASVTYAGERLSIRLAGRYAGGVLYDDQFGPEDINIRKFPDRLYLNSGFQFSLGESRNISIFGNVDNILDEDPPIIPEATGAAPSRLTRPSLYDQIGRRYMLGVRVSI